jgi:lipopolysaccharide biosynthesis glycosyltransferase
MEIVYCLDQNYVPYAEISIKSVKKYNPTAKIIIVSEEPITGIGEDENIIIKLPRTFRNRGIGDRITNTAYLKLFLPDLPYDKVLYIDGDVICQAPLNDLWKTKCNYIVLTESHNFGLQQAQALGVEKYGLTGMMLMNLKNLRNTNFTGRCLEIEQLLPTPSTGWQHDETCINVALQNKLQFTDKKFNYCINRKYDDPIREEDAVLLHYVGRQKDLMNPQYKGMDALLNNIKGKRVAIVGNAKSIFDKKNGDLIDSHDFVIRFNNGFTIKPESQGTTTTMVMLALNMPPEKLDLYHAKWIVNRSNHYDNRVNFIIPNPDRKRMRDKLEAQPSTGFMAIDLCLYAQAKSIDLFGFDGEKTPTFYNDPNYVTQHNYRKEQELIRLYEKNNLLTIY